MSPASAFALDKGCAGGECDGLGDGDRNGDGDGERERAFCARGFGLDAALMARVGSAGAEDVSFSRCSSLLSLPSQTSQAEQGLWRGMRSLLWARALRFFTSYPCMP